MNSLITLEQIQTKGVYPLNQVIIAELLNNEQFDISVEMAKQSIILTTCIFRAKIDAQYDTLFIQSSSLPLPPKHTYYVNIYNYKKSITDPEELDTYCLVFIQETPTPQSDTKSSFLIFGHIIISIFDLCYLVWYMDVIYSSQIETTKSMECLFGQAHLSQENLSYYGQRIIGFAFKNNHSLDVDPILEDIAGFDEDGNEDEPSPTNVDEGIPYLEVEEESEEQNNDSTDDTPDDIVVSFDYYRTTSSLYPFIEIKTLKNHTVPITDRYQCCGFNENNIACCHITPISFSHFIDIIQVMAMDEDCTIYAI